MEDTTPEKKIQPNQIDSKSSPMVYRLPKLTGKECPYCSNTLTDKKEFFVLLRTWNGLPAGFYKSQVPYCRKCSVPYATQLFLNQIKYETNLFLETSEHQSKTRTLSAIRKIPGDLASKVRKFERLGYSVVEQCSVSKASDIEIICNETVQDRCPACKSALLTKCILIPISVSHQVYLHGYECSKCKRFFVKENAGRVKPLFTNNSLTPWCRFDENDPYGKIDMIKWAQKEKEKRKKNKQEQARRAKIREETERLKLLKQEEFRQIAKERPSIAVILLIRFHGGQEKQIYIVDGNSKEEPERGVYRYTSSVGKELLTAAFSAYRQGKGTWEGKKYEVVVFYDSSNESYGGQRILREPYCICIGKDGGNYTSTFNDHDCVLADILLYSPITQRYEILKSTYNKRRNLYYTDIHHFREFVHTFGKLEDLDIDFDYDEKKTQGRDWNGLNTQSILNAYGYNVNQQDNLTSAERQELLAEIVDLNILSIRSICDYLEFFINSHPTHESAISRWKEDLAFISKYKYNPERFSIVQK